MLVKNEVADAPHYVVLRDTLAGAGDQFTDFTLWCLAKNVETKGNIAHYPGQFGMDLTVTMLDPVKPEFATGKYGHDFPYYGPIGYFWNKQNPGKKFEETQYFIRAKRTDHKGYFTVLYPHRPNEAVPAFTPWANGAGVTATVNGEQHTVICAEQPGKYSGNGIAFDGQRAVVREKDGRLVLALLQGRSLEAKGYSIAANGPATLIIENGSITGEANFAQAGKLLLTIPDMTTVRTTTIVTTDTSVSTEGMIQDGPPLKISLPAGRCAFVVK
jgi:hypothetical protein